MNALALTLGALDAHGDSCLGVFGAGQLGRALARGLLDAGFPAKRLLLCHGGSAETRRALEESGLSALVVDPVEMGRRCGIILAAVRPQNREALASCPLHDGALLVSFMAGTPLALLPPQPAGTRLVRVMPSAPYTITARNGIAGIFPGEEPVVPEICRALHLEPIVMETEDTLHAFTALGVCLPLALARWRESGSEIEDAALMRLARTHGLPEYARILRWARSAQPPKDAVAAAATRAGVTERILKVMDDGGHLLEALEAGIQHSRSLQTIP